MVEAKAAFTNELTDAEAERLAVLLEEMGEAQQCIGKILRHGYESYNPVTRTDRTNRRELEQELGDVTFAIQQLANARDVSKLGIEMRVTDKAAKIKPYLHHQVDL
jgi:NTP pyrophosphatase (non-canonical NTP hydrolase)